MSTKYYIKELEETIIRLIKERDNAIERIQQLEKENEAIKKRLFFYENPHTPPSVKNLKKEFAKKNKISHKKQGAPKGHRGATRKRPEPTEFVHVTAKCCPKCRHPVGKPTRTETKVIEELVKPPEIKAIQFDIDIYECEKCKFVFTAKHEDCPQEGNFGVFLLLYITMLKFYLRGVIRKIQEFLLVGNSFEISVKGIHDILLRVGKSCKKGYCKIKKRIKNSKWVHIDETTMKVDGNNWWLWIFRSSEGEILVVIRNSRGRKVVHEILGKDYDRPIIVDGWNAYKGFKITQRCWVHLLREVDEFKKFHFGKMLSEIIHGKFKELKEFLARDPNMKERKNQKKIWDREMEELVDQFIGCKKLEGPVGYIKNGLGNWHTCLLYPGMDPTNNLAEQAIREHVLVRKIIGTFHSEKGSENYQYIASLLATWRLQGKNGFEEMEQVLRKELCLS